MQLYLHLVALCEKRPIAIDCKWSAREFSPSNLLAFRRQYPAGDNLVVAHDVHRANQREYKGVNVLFLSIDSLIKRLA